MAAAEHVVQPQVAQAAVHVQQVAQPQRMAGCPGVVQRHVRQQRGERRVQFQPALADQAQHRQRRHRLGHRAHLHPRLRCHGRAPGLIGKTAGAQAAARAVEPAPHQPGQLFALAQGVHVLKQGLVIGVHGPAKQHHQHQHDQHRHQQRRRQPSRHGVARGDHARLFHSCAVFRSRVKAKSRAAPECVNRPRCGRACGRRGAAPAVGRRVVRAAGAGSTSPARSRHCLRL